MENNIFEALQLMVVGMITVFLIVMIVMNIGKLLIALVNKFAPDEAVAPKKQVTSVAAVDPMAQSVIKAAVEKLTNGKGIVKKIEKI